MTLRQREVIRIQTLDERYDSFEIGNVRICLLLLPGRVVLHLVDFQLLLLAQICKSIDNSLQSEMVVGFFVERIEIDNIVFGFYYRFGGVCSNREERGKIVVFGPLRWRRATRTRICGRRDLCPATAEGYRCHCRYHFRVGSRPTERR